MAELELGFPLDETDRSAERRRAWRAAAASLLLHLAIIAALIGLWQPRSVEEPAMPPIAVILEGPGESGTAGGGGGDGKTAGEAAHETASDPSAAAPAEAKAAAAEPSAALRPPEPMLAETEPPPETVPPPSEAAPMPVPRLAATPPPQAPPQPPRPRAKPAPHKEAAPVWKAVPVKPAEAETPPIGAAPTEAAAAETPAAAAPPGAGVTSGPAGPGGIGRGAAGSGAGSIGSGAGAGDEWLERARRRLKQFMKDPNDARKEKEYGTALLTITVAHDGRVLAAAIERSSGYDDLDRAALDMARSASPLPALPENFTPQRATFSIPASYEPGFFERIFR